jgi:hypothetical protein
VLIATAGRWRSPACFWLVAMNSSFCHVTVLYPKPLSSPMKRAAMFGPIMFVVSHAAVKKPLFPATAGFAWPSGDETVFSGAS